MSISDIIESYKLSKNFVYLMSELESKHLSKNNLSEYDAQWNDLEYSGTYNMDNHKNAMIFGSLLYFGLHPKKMIAAQKYYRSGFGATCEIPKKKE